MRFDPRSFLEGIPVNTINIAFIIEIMHRPRTSIKPDDNWEENEKNCRVYTLN